MYLWIRRNQIQNNRTGFRENRHGPVLLKLFDMWYFWLISDNNKERGKAAVQSAHRLHCGLDDRGSEFRYEKDIFVFSEKFQAVCGPTQLPIQYVPGLFPGGKAAVAWSKPNTSI